MKKYITIIFFIFSKSVVNAQVIFGGIGLDCYYQDGYLIQAYNPTKDQMIFYRKRTVDYQGIPGVGGYYYHALLKGKKHSSLGLDVGVNGAFYLSNSTEVRNQNGAVVGSSGVSGVWAFYAVPVLVSARFGRLSKNFGKEPEDNEKKYGFALGAGISPLGFYLENVNGSKIMPAVSMAYFRNNTGLRIDYAIGKYSNYYRSETGDIPKLTVRFFSVKLIYRIKNFLWEKDESEGGYRYHR